MDTRFQLTYKKGIRCGNEGYSIAIPDNFVLEEGAEERAFIAWLPDGADEYFDADIIFFDGKPVSNDNDFSMYSPELCAALLENMYWSNPFLRMMYKNSKFIPLSEGYPAGGINASYDEDNFQYNIQVFFKDCIKSMRVQVMNVTEKDIPECNKMVVDWIKTMQLAEPMGTTKKLDDPCFISAELTEESVVEWKECSDIGYTMIYQLLQSQIAVRAAKYKATLGEGVDSEKAVKKDYQTYVDATAVQYSRFLDSALNGLEAITKKNKENKLLQKLYEVICPAIMESDSVTMENPGGIKGKVSAQIPGYAELKSRFLLLMPDAEDKVEKKVPNPDFVMPTYNEKKEVLVGTMTAALPDHMFTAAEYHDEDASSEEFLDQLRERYSLVAIPDDFDKGFNFYTEGAFCINVVKPQQVPQFAALFDKEAQKSSGIELDVPSNLINMVENLLKRNGKYDEAFPIEYVCGGTDYGVVVAQVGENIDPIENWSQFVFFVFHQSNALQGNIYINALGTREQFSSAVKEWLKTFRVADKETIAAYNKTQISSALAQCQLAAKDGNIDAVRVSQLFFDDVFFMNDYEVEYKENHNIATKVQFNADVRDDYADIFANLNLLCLPIKEVMNAMEAKENLIIKKSDYHKYLQEVTWDRDITGTTLFNMCAYHMLKIVHKEDDFYVVAIDSNLIDGLPEAYAYVAEFIRELRDYNGLTGAFTAVMASMGNLNGGISRNIEQPIADAAKHESSVSITVAEGEHPYTQIRKEKAGV